MFLDGRRSGHRKNRRRYHIFVGLLSWIGRMALILVVRPPSFPLLLRCQRNVLRYVDYALLLPERNIFLSLDVKNLVPWRKERVGLDLD